MHRVEITAEVVRQADRLARFGIDPTTIATRLGITEYVAGLLVRNAGRNGRKRRSIVATRQVHNAQRGLDATTIRRIQRMLEVGMLTHTEIAREAGVSLNTITAVATGRRTAVTLSRPHLNDGERFLPEPIRCSVCRARISVVPCRACRARREMEGVAHVEAAC